VEPLANRINLSWTDELPFEELLKQASALPPHTAIFWELMIVDAAGVVHEGDSPLERLHAVANAPIFSYDESFFGSAIVGGPLLLVADTSRLTAAVAVRLLSGQNAGDIKVPPVEFSAPRFDWRQMQRWGISEKNLRPGSKILFRDPTAWEQYRWQIILICAVVLLQGALISSLLFERRRRQFAEVQVRQRSAELAHINRYSIASELTTTIAHELNQPLGAILLNAETADLIIKSPAPDLDEIGGLLADIRRDDERASEVIGRLRSLLKKAPFEPKHIDLNEVARETMRFLSALAIAREVDLSSLVSQTPLPIKGDAIQLQQVILNLIVNAMDAMSGMPTAERRITVSTACDGNFADLSVSDVGPGIPSKNLTKVFEPFFSTKPKGMGVGLSIARTIVEAHGGQLSAQNQAGCGAAFHIRLPLAALPRTWSPSLGA
jgi:signal transduction histidine kinase